MTRIARNLIIAGCLLLLLPSVAAARKAGEIIPGQFIVTFEEGVDSRSVARALRRSHGFRLRHVFGRGLRGMAIELPAGSELSILDALRFDRRVRSIGNDRYVTALQTVPKGVDRINAEPFVGANTGAGIDVAIVDTGLDFNHPDLAGNIDLARSANCIVGPGGCTAGTVSDPEGQDDAGHGTFVGGVVAANGDIVGVAPNVTLIAVKVLDRNGSGSFTDVIAGLDYLTELNQGPNPVEVANMSLGARCSVCTDDSTDPVVVAFHQAVINLVASGTTVVVAAGNEFGDSTTSIPASFDEAITVSAMFDSDGEPGGLGGATDDTFAGFSNFGPDVDVIGPGVSETSLNLGGGTATGSGTSFSAPHAAGVAAIFIRDRLDRGEPAPPPATVRQALIETGECRDGGTGLVFHDGFGCAEHWLGDPDVDQEPMVRADNVVNFGPPLPPATVYDVAVTSIGVPSPVLTGSAESVEVGVANEGTEEETLTVTLTDSLLATIGGPQTVSLPAGASTTLSFAWTPNETGDHGLTAQAAPLVGETDIDDNAKSITVSVQEPTNDVAVTAITAPTPVSRGQTADILADVANQGTFEETFTVTLSDTPPAGGSAGTVGTPQTVTALAAGTTTTLSFTWDTSGAGVGEHTLAASASVVPGESDVADNAMSTSSTVGVNDVAVTTIGVPSPVLTGSAESVQVGVANEGTEEETFTVTLTDSLAATIGGAQAVTLPAGASTTLSFAWTPTVAGAHVLTAQAAAVPGETDVADNSMSASATVDEPPVGSGPVVLGCDPDNGIADNGRGGKMNVFVTGSGFNHDATADFGPGIKIRRAKSSSASQIKVRITILAEAVLGPRTVTVINPNGESGALEGCFTVGPVQVPANDVAVTSIGVPSPVLTGSAESVQVGVANEGTEEETLTVTLTDNLAATIGVPQSVTLAAGASTTLSFAWTPTAAGGHVLTAEAAAVSGETDTADNAKSTTATVQDPVNDVAVTSIGAPSPVLTGGAESVQVGVANEGTEEETLTVTLTDSLAATIGVPQTVTLPVGASTTLSFAWTPTVAGAHGLTAEAAAVSGETDTADNAKSATATVNDPVHDVAVTSIGAPSPVLTGGAESVQVGVANEGTGEETFTVTLTDSLAATIGGAQSVTLAAGASTTLSFAWTPTVAGGHVLTAQAATVSGETDTADNAKSATATVNDPTINDVAVTSIGVPSPVLTGSPESVQVGVANEGTGEESFTVTLSDSLAATIGGAQTVTLAAGASTTLSFAWTPTVAGAHGLTAQAAAVAGETDTADNAKSATATVNDPTINDVAVTSIGAPSPALTGSLESVLVGVANEGNVEETFTVTLTDGLAATIGGAQTVTLPAGASTTLSFAWTPTAPGAHGLTAQAAAVSGETDTADNAKSATATVNDPIYDVAVTAITAPTPVTQGQTVNILVAVANQGTSEETFTVSVSDTPPGGGAAGSVSAPQTVTALAAGATTTLTFTWDTSGAGAGEHTLAASASVVPGESDVADNSMSTPSTVNEPPVGSGPVVFGCDPAIGSADNGNDGKMNVYVTGSGFNHDAESDFGPGIKIRRTDGLSGSLVKVRITILGDAVLGPRTVTVINPNGESGALGTCFTVN